MTKTLPVLSFAKLDQGMPMPHLLDIQTRAFQSLLQPDGKGPERTDVGLERVFKDVFPIQDVNGNYSLEFVKEHEKPAIKVGLVDGKTVTPEQVKRLAALPARAELLAQLGGALQAPLAGFVGAMQGLLQMLVGALEALRAQRASGAAS